MIAGFSIETHLDETENFWFLVVRHSEIVGCVFDNTSDYEMFFLLLMFFKVCIDNKINVGKWYDAHALGDMWCQ